MPSASGGVPGRKTAPSRAWVAVWRLHAATWDLARLWANSEDSAPRGAAAQVVELGANLGEVLARLTEPSPDELQDMSGDAEILARQLVGVVDGRLHRTATFSIWEERIGAVQTLMRDGLGDDSYQ